MGIAEQIEKAEKALTVKELATILQCSPKLLYKMVETQTIPHYKVGVLVRFCPTETARWIRTRRCGRST
jgi:excisionase family DNA binding protein